MGTRDRSVVVKRAIEAIDLKLAPDVIYRDFINARELVLLTNPGLQILDRGFLERLL